MPGMDLIRRDRAPALIPGHLRKSKLSLTWPERVRVYWEFTFAVSVGLLASLAGVFGADFTEGARGWGVAWGVIAIAGGIFAPIALMIGLMNVSDGTRKKDYWRALMERNRKAAPHAPERASRHPDVTYDQHSVWIKADGSKINLQLVRHKPERTGLARWPEWEYDSLGYSEVSEFTKRENYESDSYGRGGLTLVKPDYEALVEARAKMEEIAEAREQNKYDDALVEVEMLRMTLEARRPPAALERV